MHSNEVKKRIEQLRKEIEKHRYLYHVLDRQEISDAALDSLKDELYKLEQDHPQYITPDSPTQRVGGKPLDKFVKVTHQTRMLSLNDAFNEEDLQEWVDRLKRIDPRAELMFFAEPKVDGLAMSLIYEQGVLQVATTRGDGFVGEDVTHNIRTIESVPLQLHAIPQLNGAVRVEVRGEVFLTKKSFEQINAQRTKAGEPPFMNPRNTAAGSIRQLDPALAASRDLRFMAYAIPTDIGQRTHHEEHELLEKMGFKTEPHTRTCVSVAEVMKYYREIEKRREKIAYQIDGIVVAVDSNALFQRFGVAGKAPRGAIAMKFAAEQTTTIVEDIQVQVGRTGALTPVAHLRPVVVAGSMVKRATLHNMNEIERLGVRIGDTVILQKAGDVIPDVVQVLADMRTGKEKKFHMPKRCPVCGASVTRKDSEVAYYCTNAACFGQQRERFYHFVSKKAFDINGLGPKIIDQLIATDLIKDSADVFSLQENDLQPLERFAETSAKKLIVGITTARTIALSRVIYALGIRHVGEQTAVDLANHFGTFDAFQQATREQLESIHEIGPAASESILEYFADAQNRRMLKKLLPWLTVMSPARTQVSKKLAEKSFLFTGSLESMTRDDAKEKVRTHGGEVASTVNKNLDFLVAGDDPGSKLAKAEKLGVRVIDEQAFLKMIA